MVDVAKTSMAQHAIPTELTVDAAARTDTAAAPTVTATLQRDVRAAAQQQHPQRQGQAPQDRAQVLEVMEDVVLNSAVQHAIRTVHTEVAAAPTVTAETRRPIVKSPRDARVDAQTRQSRLRVPRVVLR